MPTTAANTARGGRYGTLIDAALKYLAMLWPRVDWDSPKAQDAVTTVYTSVVQRFGAGAASLAADHYDELRAEQHPRSSYRAFAADPIPDEQIAKIVKSAFLGDDSVGDIHSDAAPSAPKPQIPDPVRDRQYADLLRYKAELADLQERAISAGRQDKLQQLIDSTEQSLDGYVPTTEVAPSAKPTSQLPIDQRVQQRLENTIGRLIQQPARDTTAQNAAKDPAKPTWIRVPTGDKPCEFCLMLASRELGPNFGGYHSKSNALFKDNGEKYHNNCHCEARPVFPGQDANDISPHMATYKDIYDQAVDQAGTTRDAKKVLAGIRQVAKDRDIPSADPTPEGHGQPAPVNLDEIVSRIT